MSNNCPICGCIANSHNYNLNKGEITVVCPVCGAYCISEEAASKCNRDEVASWLYYHKKYDEVAKRFKTFYKITINEKIESDSSCVTLAQISNWYPKTLSEKVDKFLLLLDSKSSYLGEELVFKEEEITSASFAIRNISVTNEERVFEIVNQSKFLVKFLKECKYIESNSYEYLVSIAPHGYQRIDELQKNNPNNRDVFIAMSFAPKNDDTKEALKSGIISAGYVPRIMSEEIHGKQIVPMMFRIIRESQLLVMDVSDPNYGAYYEAGYAQGLGKEVIITCRKHEFEDSDNKPHFDIAQKQILVWEDYNDLKLRLSEWIKAIAG